MTISGRVVMLASEGDATRIVYHALRCSFGDVRIIIEAPQSRRKVFRRRMRTLGPVRALGQLAFLLLAVPVLRRCGRGRVAAIRREFGLDDSPISEEVIRVDSVNSDAARAALRSLSPAVVVVNGTRIIGGETLAVVTVPLINMHMGITPLYRGVHGGYWALAESRPELAGTTIHLVDHGIDTGRIIAQSRFAIAAEDNFTTYPYLHLVTGLPILIQAVRSALDGDLRMMDAPALPSRLRSHPTLAGYVWTRATRGVR